MPKVLNRKTDQIPVGAAYVGRPTVWGNPFVVGKHGSRSEVIEKYERYLLRSGLLRRISELEGRDLVCWCAPEACHADVLLRYANPPA